MGVQRWAGGNRAPLGVEFDPSGGQQGSNFSSALAGRLTAIDSQGETKGAVHFSSQGSGGGSGRRCCARHALGAPFWIPGFCHSSSRWAADRSTSQREGRRLARNETPDCISGSKFFFAAPPRWGSTPAPPGAERWFLLIYTHLLQVGCRDRTCIRLGQYAGLRAPCRPPEAGPTPP